MMRNYREDGERELGEGDYRENRGREGGGGAEGYRSA